MLSVKYHRCIHIHTFITLIMVMKSRYTNPATIATPTNRATINTTTRAYTTNKTISITPRKIIPPTNRNKCNFVRLVCQLNVPPPGLSSNHQHDNMSFQSLADNFTTLLPYILTTPSPNFTILTMNYTKIPRPLPLFPLPPHISRLNPFHPFVPPPPLACEAYNYHCQPLVHDFNLHVAVAVFGALSFLLNSFVIYRIISQNIRKFQKTHDYPL